MQEYGDTHNIYCLFLFLGKKWLSESLSFLSFTYIACLVVRHQRLVVLQFAAMALILLLKFYCLFSAYFHPSFANLYGLTSDYYSEYRYYALECKATVFPPEVRYFSHKNINIWTLRIVRL